MAGALDPILHNNQLQDISSCFSSSSLPDSSSSPDRHLHGGEREGYYDSKLLQVLVDEIFSVKKMGNGGSDSPQLEAKKRKRVLEETVKWLRGAALNPVDPAYVIREHEQEVLKMRREMYLKMDDVAKKRNEIFSVKETGNGSSDSPRLEAKKRKRELEETVKWLRGAALNPVDPAYVICEREQEVLEMRREMYLKMDDVAKKRNEIFSVRETGNGGSDSPQLEAKKRKWELKETVKWLRGAALNPVDPAYVIREREQEVLTMRREMFLKTDDVANLEDLPNFASLRKKKKVWHYSDERYKGKRRSERIAKSFNITSSRLASLRKRIGVGDLFQADVPDWLGPPSDEDLANYRNDSDTSRFLGTRLWPQKPVTPQTRRPQNLSRHVNDKLMPNYCRCIASGAVECVRYHVSVARSQLKSELGQAFRALGFDFMGEEIEKVFTREQQMLFDSLERGITPLSGPKGFWSTASNHLMTKERRHLVSYFFNVYLLRRVGNQSRLGPASAIDSDEDDMDDDEDAEQVCYDSQKGSSVIVQASRYVSSARMQSRKESL